MILNSIAGLEQSPPRRPLGHLENHLQRCLLERLLHCLPERPLHRLPENLYHCPSGPPLRCLLKYGPRNLLKPLYRCPSEHLVRCLPENLYRCLLERLVHRLPEHLCHCPQEHLYRCLRERLHEFAVCRGQVAVNDQAPNPNMIMRFTHHASAVESMGAKDGRVGNTRKTAVSVS